MRSPPSSTISTPRVRFHAAPGDDLHVSIVNRAAPGMLALVALFGAGPMYVTMEMTKGADTSF
jgi:hypothetical protein